MQNTNDQKVQDKMRNKGHYIINPPSSNGSQKTIIVLGCARSGTSMVAGVLHELGVPVGRRHDDATFEDIDLSLALESGDISTAELIIDEYNQQHDIWAWKRPGLLDYQPQAAKMVRRPYYIAIFKDVFAISNRNRISMEVEILENMDSVIKEHTKLLNILKSLDAPCLLLSNEKVLQNKAEAVDTITDFIGKGTATEKENAIEFITPNRTKYLESTRKNRSIGFLDKVSPQAVAGWAKSVFDPNKQVTVEVILNDNVIKESTANLHRKDLEQSGHGDGCYGYVIPLSDITTKPGDIISVRVKGDIVDLTNSPLAITSTN